MCAIAFDLLSQEEKIQAAAEPNRLVIGNDYHLNTGFLSTPSLCVILAEYGYLETAYKLLLQDTMPGWLYAVKKGATTIWETWDGINESGKPKASYQSPVGKFISGWRYKGEKLLITIEIPSNTQAKLILPDGSARILEQGEHRIDFL